VAIFEVLRGLVGIGAVGGCVWLLSEQKGRFPVRLLLLGLAGQIALAWLLTRLSAIASGFRALAKSVDAIQAAAVTGTQFVVGYLAGGAQPFALPPGSAPPFLFAFQALPAIILVSALSALLWHWGLLRAIVRGAAWAFGRLFGLSGPVGISTSACIFLGMVEAPLLIRPIVTRLSRGELFIVMVDGLSVIGGSMMIVLGGLVAQRVPDAFGHILSATLISTPMAILIARAIIPTPIIREGAPVELANPYVSTLEAITSGAIGGLKMAVNVAALLIAFIGLVALLDAILAALPLAGGTLRIGTILGWLLTPFAWAMGFPEGDIATAARLLGTKLTLNELVAYGQLVAMPPDALSAKGLLMLTYALGSFGNIGSLAILIGALSAMAPDKAGEVARLGPRALAAAFLTSCLSATVVGLLFSLT
jgi:CNT family concentrative nucleoside transporter